MRETPKQFDTMADDPHCRTPQILTYHAALMRDTRVE